HRLVGEHHVVRVERIAVVPLDVPAQPEREVEAILAVGPGLRHRRDHVEVLVELHQPVVDHPPHLVGGLVGGEARDQPPDVADGGLDEGVAVGGRARARLVGAALDLAVAGRQQPQPGDPGQDSTSAHATARHGGPDYFWGAGVTGAGGAAGVAGAGAAGPLDGMMLKLRLWAIIDSANEVTMNAIATTEVALPRTVGVPMDPNTAWLPLPPKAEPMSAPLPACSSTRPTMTRHTMMWTITTRMNMERYSFEAPLRAADFLAMVMKPGAWRLAPPTRTPSMSGSWVSAWALSGLTLPPYRMRIDWAISLEA